MAKVTVEFKLGDRFFHGQARLKESMRGNACFEACGPGPDDMTRVFVVKEDNTIISRPKNSRGAWAPCGRVIHMRRGTIYFIGAADELARGEVA